MCHWQEWELDLTECRKQKLLEANGDYSAHIHVILWLWQKIPLSLTWRATSLHSGGHKHFKVQLCEKARSLELLGYFSLGTMPLFGFLHTFLAPGLTDPLWMDMTSSSTWWFSGFQRKKEHLWVQAWLRMEGEITAAGKTSLLLGDLEWERSKIFCFTVI